MIARAFYWHAGIYPHPHRTAHPHPLTPHRATVPGRLPPAPHHTPPPPPSYVNTLRRHAYHAHHAPRTLPPRAPLPPRTPTTPAFTSVGYAFPVVRILHTACPPPHLPPVSIHRPLPFIPLCCTLVEPVWWFVAQPGSFLPAPPLPSAPVIPTYPRAHLHVALPTFGCTFGKDLPTTVRLFPHCGSAGLPYITRALRFTVVHLHTHPTHQHTTPPCLLWFVCVWLRLQRLDVHTRVPRRWFHLRFTCHIYRTVALQPPPHYPPHVTLPLLAWTATHVIATFGILPSQLLYCCPTHARTFTPHTPHTPYIPTMLVPATHYLPHSWLGSCATPYAACLTPLPPHTFTHPTCRFWTFTVTHYPHTFLHHTPHLPAFTHVTLHYFTFYTQLVTLCTLDLPTFWACPCWVGNLIALYGIPDLPAASFALPACLPRHPAAPALRTHAHAAHAPLRAHKEE